MPELNPGTIREWVRKDAPAAQVTAVLIWDEYIKGREPGTVLPENQRVMNRFGVSLTTAGNAKRLLGGEGALRKENGRWVVA